MVTAGNSAPSLWLDLGVGGGAGWRGEGNFLRHHRVAEVRGGRPLQDQQLAVFTGRKLRPQKRGVTCPRPHIQPGKAKALEVRPRLHSQALSPGEQWPEQEQRVEILALTVPNRSRAEWLQWGEV